jgi:hypothetical protein
MRGIGGRGLLALLLLVNPAVAHDDGTMHYDMECCHDMDCAPVERMQYVAGAYFDIEGTKHEEPIRHLVVTTRHGTASVPAGMKRRHSTDGRVHACIRAGAVVCIYLPDGS